MRNWFIFGSPRCSKNEADLKIFLVLTNEKMYPVHKRTENGPEILLFLQIPEVSFKTGSFRINYIRIFSFSTGMAPNYYA